MKKHIYNNSLTHYSFKELNAYAKMINEIIGYENLSKPNHFKLLDEDLQNRILDLKNELYLRSHRQ